MKLPLSSYYSGLEAQKHNLENDLKVWKKITDHWKKFPGHGPKKIWKYLDGINHKRIARVIKRFLGTGVSGRKQEKKKAKTTGEFNVLNLILKSLIESPNKLARGNWKIKDGKNKYQKVLEPARPFRLWTGDWKEFKIPFVDMTVYIFIILDAHTKLVVGWHLSMSKTEIAALNAAEMAIARYESDPLFDPGKLIHHVDRGSAYTSERYKKFWRQRRIALSYSDPGSPTQNGYSEGYMSLLSRFFFKYHEFESYQQLRDGLGGFLKTYNSEWKHGAIDYLTPEEKLNSSRKEV